MLDLFQQRSENLTELNLRKDSTAMSQYADDTNGPLPYVISYNRMIQVLNELTAIVHEANKKWWIDRFTEQPISRNMGEMLMLVVSELAEAMEGHRKSLKDDKLPHRSMIEVELVDAVIRIFDIAGGLGLDLGGAFAEKMIYNANREDHKLEHRRSEHGKAY